MNVDGVNTDTDYLGFETSHNGCQATAELSKPGKGNRQSLPFELKFFGHRKPNVTTPDADGADSSDPAEHNAFSVVRKMTPDGAPAGNLLEIVRILFSGNSAWSRILKSGVPGVAASLLR